MQTTYDTQTEKSVTVAVTSEDLNTPILFSCEEIDFSTMGIDNVTFQFVTDKGISKYKTSSLEGLPSAKFILTKTPDVIHRQVHLGMRMLNIRTLKLVSDEPTTLTHTELDTLTFSLQLRYHPATGEVTLLSREVKTSIKDAVVSIVGYDLVFSAE